VSSAAPLETLSLAAFALFFVSWALLAVRRLAAGCRAARLGQLDEPWLQGVMDPRLYKPISILVPLHNTAAQVVAQVRALLKLEYPQFELVLVNDDSTDDTLEKLLETFQMVRLPTTARTVLPSRTVRAAYRSALHPNLLVVDKEGGGRSDALNAAINHAHYPLILFADTDLRLDGPSLVLAGGQFIENEQLAALVGTHQLRRPEQREDSGLPPTLLQRFQLLEQARVFLFGPGLWRPNLVASWGLFGLFAREEVLNVEGLSGGGAAEFELVLRLQKRASDFGLPYQIGYDPRFLCHKEAPPTWKTLLRQRVGWQRGVQRALWAYRKLFFKPKYRPMVWALPEAWFYQIAAPVFMSLGYLSLLSLTLLGRSEFLGVFLVFASFFGLLISSLALYAQSVYTRGIRSGGSLLTLWLDAFLEPIFYQPILTFTRLGVLMGGLRFRRRRQRSRASYG
jgi:cellulose synthase/poly-beta-1,6-N-acetylglucosamine synthase-like glycosyltransferase